MKVSQARLVKLVGVPGADTEHNGRIMNPTPTFRNVLSDVLQGQDIGMCPVFHCTIIPVTAQCPR